MKPLKILILIVFFGCSNNSFEENEKKDIRSFPIHATVILNNSTNSPVSIELLDSIEHQSDNWIVNYSSIDTISLKLSQPARVTVHSLIHYRQTKFISNGDTLRIDLSSDEMQVRSTDRLDAQKIVEQRSELLSETDSLFNLFIPVDSSLGFKGVAHRLSVVKSYGVSGNKLLKERNPEVFNNLVQNLINQLEAMPASLVEIDNPESEGIKNLKIEINRKEALTRLALLASQLDEPDLYDRIFKSNFYRTGIFADSPYARSYLSFLINQFVLEGEEDRSRNKSYVDYKKAYDKMSEYLEGELLEFARKISLEQMVSYEESNLNLKKYLSKFLKDHADSVFVESFENRFLLSYDKEISATSDLMLTSHSGSRLTFSDLVEDVSDSSQIFYLDFWASWCAPCRKAMPFSEEKRKLYESKGVKFIYLSMDRDKQKWKTASLSHQLETYEHSYLLINPEEQQLIKDLKIEFIPRYVLLNQMGEVVERNAPGPEGDLLNEMLAAYLNR